MSKAGGIVLSIIGGTVSIVLFGMLLQILYPEFLILGRLFITIFQVIMILGGVITLIGAFISILAKTENIKKLAWIAVLIGAILGGGNVLAILGAVQLKQESLKTIKEKNETNKIKCPVCSYENDINNKICRYCGKELIS